MVKKCLEEEKMYNRSPKVGWKIKDLLKRIDFKLGTPLPGAKYKIRDLPATGSKMKGRKENLAEKENLTEK